MTSDNIGIMVTDCSHVLHTHGDITLYIALEAVDTGPSSLVGAFPLWTDVDVQCGGFRAVTSENKDTLALKIDGADIGDTAVIGIPIKNIRTGGYIINFHNDDGSTVQYPFGIRNPFTVDSLTSLSHGGYMIEAGKSCTIKLIANIVGSGPDSGPPIKITSSHVRVSKVISSPGFIHRVVDENNVHLAPIRNISDVSIEISIQGDRLGRARFSVTLDGNEIVLHKYMVTPTYLRRPRKPRIINNGQSESNDSNRHRNRSRRSRPSFTQFLQRQSISSSDDSR